MNQPTVRNLLPIFARSPGGNLEMIRGLRTAVAVILPMIIMVIIQQPSVIWMALGGLYTSIADVGGAYRIRAMTMLSVAVGGTLSLGFSIAVGVKGFSIFFMFVWAFGCGMLNVYGNSGFIVGLLIACNYLVGIDVSPHNTFTAVEISLLYLVGSFWGIILALGFWPLYPYQPVRQSISECYQVTSKLLSLAKEFSTLPPEESRVYKQKFILRQKLVAARETLWATRITRQGVSPIEEHLIILTQMVEEMFNATTTIIEFLATAKTNDFPDLWSRIYDYIGDIILFLSKLTVAIEGKVSISDSLSLTNDIFALRQKMDAKKAIDQDWQHSYQEILDIYYIVNILDKYSKYIKVAIASINSEVYQSSLKSKFPTLRQTILLDIFPVNTDWLVTLRDNLTLQSMVFRHSLRFAITSFIALLIAKVFDFPNGYWITLTVAVVLKPHAGETFTRGFQRLIGTIGGGIIGILLAIWITNPFCLVLLLIPFSIAMMSVLKIDYGLFVFFLTPFVVLINNIEEPGKWLVAIWRIQSTLIGGGLAILASYVILPRWEYQQPLEQLAKMLRTNCHFFENVMAVYLGQTIAPKSFNHLNQRVRVTMVNAHMSFQQSMNQIFSYSPRVEPLLTLIILNQRFINSLVILQNHSQDVTHQIFLPQMPYFTGHIVDILNNLAQAITTQQQPKPLPDLEIITSSIYQHLEELHTRRITELNQGLQETPTRQLVISQTLILEQITAIILEVKAMYDAIKRFYQQR